MKMRTPGHDAEVSASGLNCMGMIYVYGPADDKAEMVALIHAAIDKLLRGLPHAGWH